MGEALAFAIAKRGYHAFATAWNPANAPETLSSLTVDLFLKLVVLSTDLVAEESPVQPKPSPRATECLKLS